MPAVACPDRRADHRFLAPVIRLKPLFSRNSGRKLSPLCGNCSRRAGTAGWAAPTEGAVSSAARRVEESVASGCACRRNHRSAVQDYIAAIRGAPLGMAQAEPRNPPARTSPTRAPTWRQSKAPRWASRRHSQATIAREQTLPAHCYVVATRARRWAWRRRSHATFAREQALPAHRYVVATRARRWAWRRRSHATFAPEQTAPAHCYVVATRGAPLGIAHAQLGHLRTRASTAGAPLRGRNQGRTAGHRARPVRSPSDESKHCRRTATWSQPGAHRWASRTPS